MWTGWKAVAYDMIICTYECTSLQSLTFKNMLELMGIEQESNTDDTIPITNDEVTGENFKKALVWMEKNRGKPIVQK